MDATNKPTLVQPNQELRQTPNHAPVQLRRSDWLLFIVSLLLFVLSVWVLPVIEVRGTTGIESIDSVLRILGAGLSRSKTLSSALIALWDHRSEPTNLILLALLGIPLVLAILKYLFIFLTLFSNCTSRGCAIGFKILKPQTLISLLEVFICAVTVLSFFGINFVIVTLNVSIGFGVITYLASIFLSVMVATHVSSIIDAKFPALTIDWMSGLRYITTLAGHQYAVILYTVTLGVVIAIWNLPLWSLRPCIHLGNLSGSSVVDCSQCDSNCVTYIAYAEVAFDSLVVPDRFSSSDLERILKLRGWRLKSLELSGERLDMRKSLHLVAKYCPNLSVIRLPGSEIAEIDLVLLRPLARLQELSVDGSSLEDKALFHLEGFQFLESLNLANTKVHGKGLMYLAKIGSLRKLTINGSQLDELGWFSLGSLNEVTTLTFVDGSSIPDERLPFLTPMRSLVHIASGNSEATFGPFNKARTTLGLNTISFVAAPAK